jgi:hypothetical protein
MDRQLYQIIVAIGVLYVTATMFGGYNSVSVTLLDAVDTVPAIVWSDDLVEIAHMTPCEFSPTNQSWSKLAVNPNAYFELRDSSAQFGPAVDVALDEPNSTDIGRIITCTVIIAYIIYSLNRLYTRQHIRIKSHSVAALRYTLIASVVFLLVAYAIVLRVDVQTLGSSDQDGLRAAANIVAFTLLPVCIVAIFARLVTRTNQSLFAMFAWTLFPLIIVALIRISDKHIMYTCDTGIESVPITAQPATNISNVYDMCRFAGPRLVPIDQTRLYATITPPVIGYRPTCFGATNSITISNYKTHTELALQIGLLFGGSLVFICFYATQLVYAYPVIVTATLFFYLASTDYITALVGSSSPYVLTGNGALYLIIVLCTFTSLMPVSVVPKQTQYTRDPISTLFKALM